MYIDENILIQLMTKSIALGLVHSMSLSAKMLYSAFEALVGRWYKYYFYSYLMKLILHISFPL